MKIAHHIGTEKYLRRHRHRPRTFVIGAGIDLGIGWSAAINRDPGIGTVFVVGTVTHSTLIVKKPSVIVIAVLLCRLTDLLEVAGTSGTATAFPGILQSRQQNRRQYRYYRNHHEQFNQSETGVCGGQGKLFFTGKKVFPFPRAPFLFQKKRGDFAPVLPSIARRAKEGGRKNQEIFQVKQQRNTYLTSFAHQ